MIPILSHFGVRLLASSLWLLAFALPVAHASRNPLDLLRADSCDDRSPSIRVEADAPAADPAPPAHLANVHDGDFALFRALDFDSGVAAFRATVAGPRSGTLELRLDSPTGPLLVACPFRPSGGWDQSQDITANVDNTQAGVRDVYVFFRAPSGEPPNPRALVNLRSFVFLKSVVTPSTGGPDLASRLDSPDTARAWITPEYGYKEDLWDEHQWRQHWKNLGDLSVATVPNHSPWRLHEMRSAMIANTSGEYPLFAYNPEVYINKTDVGYDWRSLAEGCFSAVIFATKETSRPGLGFTSKDGQQAIYATINPKESCIEVWRKLTDGTTTRVARHPQSPSEILTEGEFAGKARPVAFFIGHRLELKWSPYSNALLVSLRTGGNNGRLITSFRTAVDLPAARFPLLVNSGGPAGFMSFRVSSTDTWNYRWEWYKQPVLTPDVCNPAVWRGPGGQMYMMWRRFGADTFHGIARSDDGIHWTRVTEEAILCTGDMTVLPDPFGDGKWYATPGGKDLPWWTSDGSDDFRHWTQTDKTIGDIHGHNRIQEIIDTARYPQLKPVHFEGKDYRFIAYCEDWVHAPQPHSVVLLSNTLTDWVQPSPDPVVPPADDFWGEKGNAIGSAFPLPDGNLLLSVCACTNAGYTGAPEPTNITAVASGTEPWKLLRKGTLPDAPVSRENVWYQGPNFGTAFFYDDKTDTLFLYGGFHDYHIGVMRVRNFLHPDSPRE